MDAFISQRKLFGHVVAQDPTLLANQYGTENPENMPSKVTKHLVLSAIEHGAARGPNAPNYSLLESGISDIQEFYSCVLRSPLELDMESKRSITMHPLTRRTLTNLALADSFEIRIQLGTTRRSKYDFVLSDNGEYIQRISDFSQVPDKGCPFAGNNPSAKIDPLFNKFCTWSTNLILEHHRINQEAN